MAKNKKTTKQKTTTKTPTAAKTKTKTPWTVQVMGGCCSARWRARSLASTTARLALRFTLAVQYFFGVWVGKYPIGQLTTVALAIVVRHPCQNLIYFIVIENFMTRFLTRSAK